MPRWVVDHEAVNKAQKTLKLSEHVKIKLITDPDWAGVYWPLHVVWVNRKYMMHDVDPSFTIWHELAHAIQCERDFNGDSQAFLERMDEDYESVTDEHGYPTGDDEEWFNTYEAIPWEQEADALAWKYYEKKPLIKLRS